MKTIATVIVATILSLALAPAAHAKWLNVLIYCTARPSEIMAGIKEHWKDELPDLGAGAVIRDHKLLAKQGQKRFYHALVEKSEDNSAQFSAIKTYVKTYNDCSEPGVIWSPDCGTALNEQIMFWAGETAEDAYKALWQDRSIAPLIKAIAKRVLRYPVQTTCEGEPCTRIVSVTEAEDTYGETVNAQKILIPHEFYGK